MKHITTYTGIPFYPLDPKIEDIYIGDIAHALSLMCRGNGHVKTFYSVGQHCINCALEAQARGYSERVILACLLHDASECYMSDVPRPFKKLLTEYLEHEEKLLNIIYEKYLGSSLTDDEAEKLKEIDDDMLYFDLKMLLKENPKMAKPVLKAEINYEFVPFIDVENKYLEIFNTYYKK